MHYQIADAVNDIQTAMGLNFDAPARFPAEIFEEKTGLHGISHRYTLPEGESSETIQHRLLHHQWQDYALANLLHTAEQVEPFNAASIAGDIQDYGEIAATLAQEIETLASTPEAGSDAAEELAYEYYELQNTTSHLHAMEKLFAANPDFTLNHLRSAHEQAQATHSDLVQDYFQQLTQLNPELRVLDVAPDQLDVQSDVVHGVISRFNIADIKRFSVDGVTYRQAQEDPAWLRKTEAIEARSGAKMPWVPSHSTLDHITRQLDRREAKGISH